MIRAAIFITVVVGLSAFFAAGYGMGKAAGRFEARWSCLGDGGVR